MRKAAAEYEEQNAALRKHVETLQAAVSRLEAETEQQRRHSAALQHHLDSLRDVLANSFAHLPLPGALSFLLHSGYLSNYRLTNRLFYLTIFPVDLFACLSGLIFFQSVV